MWSNRAVTAVGRLAAGSGVWPRPSPSTSTSFGCRSALFGEKGPAMRMPLTRGVNKLPKRGRSEEHTSVLQSRLHLVCRLLLEKKKKKDMTPTDARVRGL